MFLEGFMVCNIENEVLQTTIVMRKNTADYTNSNSIWVGHIPSLGPYWESV